MQAAVAATTPPATAADAIERLGVAGILAVAAYFLIRYFMSIIEKKELRLNDVTDRFLTTTEKHATVVEEFTGEVRELRRSNEVMSRSQESMATAISELKGALRREPRT